MVDGMEDDEIFWEIIGVVEVAMEVTLLLFGSLLGSMMIIICKDVMGIDFKSRGMENDIS